MDIHTQFSMAALLFSLGCCAFVIRTNRRTQHVIAELARYRELGVDAYVSEQVARWVAGDLPGRTETLANGDVIEVIEPMPGWRISAGSIVSGKRIPLANQNA